LRHARPRLRDDELSDRNRRRVQQIAYRGPAVRASRAPAGGAWSLPRLRPRTTPRTRAANLRSSGPRGAVGARGAPGAGTWKPGILGTCGAAARGRFSVFQDFRFSPSQLRTRRGASPGAQPAASCRIRSAPFDYRVKAPRAPAAEHHAAIKEIVSIKQGE